MTAPDTSPQLEDLLEAVALRQAANRIAMAKRKSKPTGNPEKPLTRRDAGGT
jgi:hypothetical protein